MSGFPTRTIEPSLRDAAASFRDRAETIRLGGGPEAIRRQHGKGRPTAREGIAKLVEMEQNCVERGIWAAEGQCREGGGAARERSRVVLQVRGSRKDGQRGLDGGRLGTAGRRGNHGGAGVRAMAGLGRRGGLHEGHCCELAGDMTVGINFAVSDEEAERLLALITAQRISIFYARVPMEYGMIAGDS